MRFQLNRNVKAGLVGVAIIGALVVTIGVIGPALVQATMASEPTVATVFAPAPAGKALDTHLVRFGDNYDAIQTEPGISLDPQSSVTVRKIAFGQTSFVTVMTTSSGVYSTDGLANPHVRYPGVHVAQLDLEPDPAGDAILGWSKLTGWTKIPLVSADSFAFLNTTTAPNSTADVCVKDTATGICR